jgi:DNA polymerase (family 10)
MTSPAGALAGLPASARELLHVAGLGAKTVRRLWREAGVRNLGELVAACEDGRVAELSGFGARRQAQLLRGARSALDGKARMLLATALEMGRLANEALLRAGLAEAVVVGDARRGVEIVGELSMIARGPSDARAVARALERAVAGDAVIVEGNDTVRMRFEGGGPARVRVVPRTRFVEALVRETGTAIHVRWLESLAARAGGLSAVCARATSEEAVYSALGVPFPTPELREGPTPRIADLVREVRGIFHVHTTWSDGAATIVDMARAAAEAGFGYVGITEHSKAASYAGGLDSSRLRQQARAMGQARRAVREIDLLHGVEVDILADGSLDLDDTALASLDFVIASVHTQLEMGEAAMTARLVRAVSHPLVTILGHPTGRLLLGRKGAPFDIDAVATAAAANDTFLEINANPQRLDLSEDLARRAAGRGARFAINPDAHSPRGLRDTGLGVTLARRAGLAPAQILNTLGADEIAVYLARRRRKAKRLLALS